MEDRTARGPDADITSMTADRVRWRDVAREAADGIRGRRVASLVAVLIVGLATAGLLAGDIVGRSSAADVDARLELLRARWLTVRSTPSEPLDHVNGTYDDTLLELPFVKAAGMIWRVPSVEVTVEGIPVQERIPVLATSIGALEAMGVRLAAGRVFDRGHSRRGDAVALVGSGLANRLAMGAQPGAVVEIGGRTFAVIGVIADVSTETDALLGVVIPAETASRWWVPEPNSPPRLVVEVEPGTSAIAHDALPVFVRPTGPHTLAVDTPLEPEALISDLSRQLQVLLLSAGAILAIIGAATITAQLSGSVHQRRSEIGLRRALGADRRHLVAQLMLEGMLLAGMGAVVGVVVTMAVAGLLASLRGTAFVVAPWSPVVVPIAVIVGILAAWFPGRRAARIDPAEALRGVS